MTSPELPPEEPTEDQHDCDYEAPRIESVITAEQMERESLYAGSA